MEILKNGLVPATVGHERVKPVHNRFSYKVYYLAFPVRLLPTLKSAFLSINHLNIWSVYLKDHGKRDGSLWESWVRENLSANGLDKVCNGDIVVMMLPRLLSYGFNPITFWFCLDELGVLRAVLCEVNNTFGDHHNYLVAHEDGRAIHKDEKIKAKKMMYVSPFNPVEGEYFFRFNYTESKIEAWIDYHTEGSLKLATYVGGPRVSLSTTSLLKMFFTRPMMTFFVVGRIHWQAVRLLWKGLRFANKPKHESGKTTKAND